MLSTNELRRVAKQSGARDIGNVEIDVILTYLLQLFTEKGIMEHVAFKGGTMLRKMVFGPRGRLSTDLDFTCRTDIKIDDLLLQMWAALDGQYHGISFRFDRNRDLYTTQDGCAANPVCYYNENQNGIKIKLQVSTRECPILPIFDTPQLKQDYFSLLPFTPSSIPSLDFVEAVAEKIRAASQRSKIRDLHDLSEIAKCSLNRDLIRSLAVLKLWNSGGSGLDYTRFSTQIKNGEYNVSDLTNLLRKDQKPDLDGMISRVVDSYKFLANLTEAERLLSLDGVQEHREKADELVELIRQTNAL